MATVCAGGGDITAAAADMKGLTRTALRRPFKEPRALFRRVVHMRHAASRNQAALKVLQDESHKPEVLNEQLRLISQAVDDQDWAMNVARKGGIPVLWGLCGGLAGRRRAGPRAVGLESGGDTAQRCAAATPPLRRSQGCWIPRRRSSTATLCAASRSWPAASGCRRPSAHRSACHLVRCGGCGCSTDRHQLRPRPCTGPRAAGAAGRRVHKGCDPLQGREGGRRVASARACCRPSAHARPSARRDHQHALTHGPLFCQQT